MSVSVPVWQRAQTGERSDVVVVWVVRGGVILRETSSNWRASQDCS